LLGFRDFYSGPGRGNDTLLALLISRSLDTPHG